MLLKTYTSGFILAVIKYVEAHEARIHWTLMKILNSTISTQIKMASSRLFLYLVFQGQEIPRQDVNEKQKKNMCK